jgi:hypothetical protein
MIQRDQLPELRSFAKAEQALPLQADPTLAPFVTPNGNLTSPVHRWFRYKESFSSDLLHHLLTLYPLPLGANTPFCLLDPFCGVGTSLLSAQLSQISIASTGIECNPFSAFVAKTKLAWPTIDITRYSSWVAELLAMPTMHVTEWPSLSSITSGRCVTPHMAERILSCRDAIKSFPPGPERDALLLGLAASIEPLSRVRRDGRALRLVNKPRTLFRGVLSARLSVIAEDLAALRNRATNSRHQNVTLGDGRSLDGLDLADSSVDLLVTSPPYPNNIDYNEVYKLEMWFLGLAHNSQQFLDLRRATFRSHPTCSPFDPAADQSFRSMLSSGPLHKLIGTVVAKVTAIEEARRRGRLKVLLGYIYDTWMSLRSHLKVLKPHAYAFYVVGNSLHGATNNPYLIPTDLILATLAELVGFRVHKILIARGLQRRLSGNHFLRDSVVVLRKPQ